MHLAPLAQLLVLAAVASPTMPGSSVQEQGASEPIATRQTIFGIPFRIDRPDSVAREPVEVRLFVSSDRGKTWRLYSRVEPDREQFMFRAASDGEYWFLVRTLDRSGQLRPQGASEPGLKVVVDTVPPSLELQAQRGPAGQITARWLIAEPYLGPENITILYRSGTEGPWEPVAVDRQSVRRSGFAHTGEVTWWPRDDGAGVQVRAEVTDAAGNLAVSHAKVGPGPAPAPRPSPAAESPFPVAENGSSGTGLADSGWRAGAASPPATPWAPQGTADSPFGPGSSRGNYTQANVRLSGPEEAAAPMPNGPIAVAADPPIHNQYVPPAAQGDTPSNAALPPERRLRLVNSRLFELEYDARSIEPSKIRQVELWGTRDGGETWRSYTLDDDNRSPLLVKVDEEGVYGFRVVVTTSDGLGGGPPKSGEPPEIRIGVDLSKPTAMITGTQPGPDPGSLTIFWQADDNMPAPRPASLLYSEHPGGPWTGIASELDLSGRYTWEFDDRVPKAVYLRLEVRDQAGNVGVFETAQPVPLGQSSPSVHIRDIRPLDQSNRRSPAREYFR